MAPIPIYVDEREAVKLELNLPIEAAIKFGCLRTRIKIPVTYNWSQRKCGNAVYYGSDADDSDSEFEYCDEERVDEVYSFEILLGIPEVNNHRLKVKIKMTDSSGIWGFIQEVKEDTSSPDILLGKKPEQQSILSDIEFFDLMHPYPRESHSFELLSMTDYKQMWNVDTVDNATRDFGLFTDSTNFDFGLTVDLSSSYIGYLRYVQANKGKFMLPFILTEATLEQVFYKDGKYTDVEILVGEKTFRVHSEILQMNSPILAAMLSSGFKESQENKIQLEGFPADSVKEMISFFYTNRLSEWSQYCNMELMLDLLLLSDMYAVPGLKDLAVTYYLSQPLCAKGSGYRDNLDTDLALRWFQTACLQDSDELIQRSAQFISIKLEEMEKKSEWKTLVDSNAKLAGYIKAAIPSVIHNPPQLKATLPTTSQNQQHRYLEGWIPPFGEYIITFEGSKELPRREFTKME